MVSVVEHPWIARHLMIPQRLRHRRDELGLTQKQVVNRLARIGVATTNRALSSLEHGGGLDVAKLPELAQVLECTVTYLLGLTDDPRRWEPDTSKTDPAPDSTATALPRTSGILGLDVPERRRPRVVP
jgi:transcriptional regulator with XRE-family HTH domain